MMKRKLIVNKGRRRACPCLFLDRDGVIINDCHYISKPGDVKLRQGARELIAMAKKEDFRTVIVTNQSGIGRGVFGWPEYNQVTKRMLELLGKEGEVDAIYANGYVSGGGIGHWRKPGAGMLIEAKADLGVNIKRSILVGDRLTDIQAGYNAGVKRLVYIRSEHKLTEDERIEDWDKEKRRDGKRSYELVRCDRLLEEKLIALWIKDNDIK